MEENKTYFIMTATVNKEHMEEVQSYLANVMPIFAKHGGMSFGRFKVTEQLVGENGPEMIGIIEFPSADAAKEMLKSEDFMALAESRKKVFRTVDVMLSSKI
ncbi:hypothetical protein COB64_00310 [Candidatus Wolfebacteria bacterium]|nr:MAG: hypothetical protein COB64_00310 [Candidatus Wolfebacteria bacterium]